MKSIRAHAPDAPGERPGLDDDDERLTGHRSW
jgi:hypothetical protein